MQIVTGGAGFIGSNLVRALNQRGVADILVVDRLNEDNFHNLADCRIADYMDADEFRGALQRGALPARVEAIYHQGACADTTESDARYLMENNFTFSKAVLELALARKTPLVYASSAAVYGNSTAFVEDPRNERPLNPYALSKLIFDQHVRSLPAEVSSTVVGLRYFNVYGPREAHKAKMSSMVYQLYRQLRDTGVARLFKGTGGYGDGEQRRDFVFVGDVVAANLSFASGPSLRGIFNLGTGQSRTFNEVARTLIRLGGQGEIRYIPFDPVLAGKYQSFTEADLTALRAAGYESRFTGLEDGVAQACAAWENEG